MQLARLSWAILATFACAQPPAPDFRGLLADLRQAVGSDSLTSAVEAAQRLEQAVQQRYADSLLRNADEKVAEALQVFPPDIESVWVHRDPFVIDPTLSQDELQDRPLQVYATDHLRALEQGAFFRALAPHAIGLTVAGARKIVPGKFGIPGPIGSHEVAYFHYFDAPVELPAQHENINGKPIWQTTASFPDHKDTLWLALPKPDLLILTNHRVLLEEILERLATGRRSAAFPATLGEWTYVNREASFWGLRHLGSPQRQGIAVGVHHRQLEIHFLQSSAPLSAPEDSAFSLASPDPAHWVATSDLAQHGAWPVHYSLAQLGFGLYR